MEIKIISWNIWFGKFYDTVVDFLAKSEAPIIGLQEVTQTKTGKNNIGQKLARKLGYNYTYATGMDLEPHGIPLVMGNAVLSKYPIISTQVHNLSQSQNRVAVQANIQVNKDIIHIISAHLLHTHQHESPTQNEQAKNLSSLVPKTKTVIMGDFNSTPTSSPIKIMCEKFNTPTDITKPTWSMYPEGCEECLPQELNIRLDYFFTSKDIVYKDFKIHSSKGSDHLPMSITIEV